MKQIVPYHAKDIFSIPLSFFQEKKIKAVISDLDNTLDAYNAKEPSQRVKRLKERLDQEKISLYVVSNNKEKRVGPYCHKLGVKYLSDAKKYSKRKTEKFLKDNGLCIDEVIFVGDQLFTDRIYVKKLHGRLILTDPIVKEDAFFTRFIRPIDSFFRKRWDKKNALGEKIH